jgi:hypothetical protein
LPWRGDRRNEAVSDEGRPEIAVEADVLQTAGELAPIEMPKE